MKRFTALVAIGAIALGVLGGGAAAKATTPGRNGRIAFSSDVGLGAEIYVMDSDGTGLRQLTEMPGDIVNSFSPDWSPDGSRIAFWLEDEAGGTDRVYVMNADGSDLHVVASPGGQVAWTPDGMHLVYECPCDPSGIFLVQADGSDAPGVRLSSNPFPDEGDGNPEVSPDGKTVTFVRHKEDGVLQALFAVGIDGTNERMVVPYKFEVAIKHDWAPDGRQIALTLWGDSPDGHLPTVATVNPDGTELRRLTKPQGDTLTLVGSYSPNGSWIVFRVQNNVTETYKLIKMHPNGTDRTVIARPPFVPRFIDWGPRPA